MGSVVTKEKVKGWPATDVQMVTIAPVLLEEPNHMSSHDLLLILGTAIVVIVFMKSEIHVRDILLEVIGMVLLFSSLIIGTFLGRIYIGDLGTGYSVVGETLGGMIGFMSLVIMGATLEKLGFIFPKKQDRSS